MGKSITNILPKAKIHKKISYLPCPREAVQLDSFLSFVSRQNAVRFFQILHLPREVYGEDKRRFVKTVNENATSPHVVMRAGLTVFTPAFGIYLHLMFCISLTRSLSS